MIQELSEEIIKDQYELYNRLKNDVRKDLLSFLYEQSRNYKELAEFSGLKPGSLYHHLGVLEPLIEKFDHGQYKITELGKKIMESLDMVSSEKQKPKITATTSESAYEDLKISNRDNENIPINDNQDTVTDGYKHTVAVEKVVKHPEDTSSLETNSMLYYIWLSPTYYILVFLSLLVIFLLGLQGVAFAGSAIYAVGGINPFIVDLLAIILGIGSLFILEDLLQKYPIYDRIKFITIIRIISMLPSLMIGLTLLLLYMSGIVVVSAVYPIIFAIGLFMGTLTMTIGIHYLRAQPISDAILYAVVPSTIDLLIGLVILLSI